MGQALLRSWCFIPSRQGRMGQWHDPTAVIMGSPWLRVDNGQCRGKAGGGETRKEATVIVQAGDNGGWTGVGTVQVESNGWILDAF